MPGELRAPSNLVARQLGAALASAGVSIDALADRTKVPTTTIRYLLGEHVSAILPERVYLRGHLGILAHELGVDRDGFESAFDLTYPAASEPRVEPPPARRRHRAQSVAVSAALGGMAVVSVVAAFVSAIG